MTLLARLARAVTARERPPESTPLLIYDTIHSFLTNHALVQATDVCTHDVHDALIDLHKFYTLAPLLNATPVAPNCTACGKGYIILDHRCGVELCDRCGVIHNTCVDYLPFYQHDEPLLYDARPPNGVSKWMLALQQKNSTDEYEKDVEHWNHYAKLPTTALEKIIHTMNAWHAHESSRKHTHAVRLVAAFLYDDVSAHFADQQTLRTHVRGATMRRLTGVKRTLDEATTRVPPAQFFCPQCNAGLHDRKSANWHCRGMNRFARSRRRRR